MNAELGMPRVNAGPLTVCSSRHSTVHTCVTVSGASVTRAFYSTPDREAEYCGVMCVCVFVCPRSYLRNYTADLRQFFMLVTYGRGSVFGRRCDTLYTSGFMGDVIVIFAHKPRLLDVAAQLNRNAYAVLGLAICCARLCGFWTLADQPPVRGSRSYSPRDRTL